MRIFFAVICCTLVTVADGADGKTKPASGPIAVKCCGLVLRTDFGHPERMAELGSQADIALQNCVDSGKIKGLTEAFDVYLQQVDTEFGDAANRDILRTRLNQIFKAVEKDDQRSAHLLEGYRHFAFASVLSAKRLSSRSIEEVKQARASFLRAVPPDSFCLMPVDLYLATQLSDSGQTNEALSICQSVVARGRKNYGKDDEFLGFALGVLGKIQMAAGMAPDAEESLRQAMSVLSDSPEIQPHVYLMNCKILGEALEAQSKNAETAELTSYLEPQMRKLYRGQLFPPVINVVTMRGKAYLSMKRYEDAEKAFGRYPELIQSLREPGEPERQLLAAYVTLLEKTGRGDQTAAIRKLIDRIDAKLPQTAKRSQESAERN
jgi:tetratricopeptide (TPR) repeat protein